MQPDQECKKNYLCTITISGLWNDVGVNEMISRYLSMQVISEHISRKGKNSFDFISKLLGKKDFIMNYQTFLIGV